MNMLLGEVSITMPTCPTIRQWYIAVPAGGVGRHFGLRACCNTMWLERQRSFVMAFVCHTQTPCASSLEWRSLWLRAILQYILDKDRLAGKMHTQ